MNRRMGLRLWLSTGEMGAAARVAVGRVGTAHPTEIPTETFGQGLGVSLAVGEC